MSILVLTCPHCSAEKMTFRVIAGTVSKAHGEAPFANVFCECPGCGYPICLEVVSKKPGTVRGNVSALINQAVVSNGAVMDFDFHVVTIWPSRAKPEVPEHLPSPIAKAFTQGEVNIRMVGCEEAAATMYRRSLDIALKTAFPDHVGSLAARIDRLVASNLLPKTIGDWAHQVRLIGNDGAHDVEGLDRSDVVVCRDFVDSVLRYTFSLPKMVEERRAAAAHLP